MARHFGGINPVRQNERTRILILAGVFLVLTLSAVAFLFASSAPTAPATRTVVIEKEAELKMADVLVPVQRIDAGAPLEPAMFKLESRPQVGLNDRVIKSFEQIRNHYARSLIVAGVPLDQELITPVRPTSLLTAKIPEGFRAVTIRVDARSSVEGFARPGARVDVVWASKIRGQPGVVTIVQNAEVLSAEREVDQNTKPGAPIPSTVTLLVSAGDAAKIQLASTTGSLSLQLRGDSDVKGDTSQPITIDDLLGKRPEGNDEAGVEGTVKFRGPSGQLEEYRLKNGKLVPLQGQ